jgi:hypothetical protein
MALPDRRAKEGNMQYQVPQNIDLEDKIIGPLTLKQFIFLLIGGMLDYAWYTFFDVSLFILLAIPTTLFALAMAFARVQDQPFPKFLASLIIFILRPKMLTWGKTIKPKIIESKTVKKEKIIHPKMASESQIQKLAQIIDTQGWSGTTGEAQTQKKLTPPLKQKESFFQRISHLGTQVKSKQLIRPQISQPQAKNWRPPKNAQIITSAELEQELGLAGRVKTHEVAKPKMNLGAASENTPVDILEKTEPPSGKKR